MIQAIHISDTHIGPTPDFEFRGANTLERTKALLKAISELDFKPDLIVHTGDVTNHPEADSYAIAAEVFSRLEAPVYFASGNHDDAVMMHRLLPMGPKTSIVEDPGRIAYRIDLDGHRCFILDARIPDDEGPHGRLPADQLESLESELAGSTDPFSLFVHFQPFPIGSPWIDEFLPLQNGAEFHRLLLKFGHERNRGVFFGHLHRGIQIHRDGILYSGVASPAFQFTAWVGEKVIESKAPCPIAFNHITFYPDSTVIKEYTVLP